MLSLTSLSWWVVKWIGLDVEKSMAWVRSANVIADQVDFVTGIVTSDESLAEGLDENGNW